MCASSKDAQDLRNARVAAIITQRSIGGLEDGIVRVLTISELERASGVPRSTIHYYIREGLLPQPQKTAGTRSLYSEDHVELLAQIAEAKATGRSLSDMRPELLRRSTQLGEKAIDLEVQEYERVHRAILHLATKEFVRRGYRDTRLSDLIRGLEISSSVFYGHFPSKRRLWVECFSTLVDWSIAYLEPRLAESDDVVDRMLTRTAAGFSLHGLSRDLLALTDAEAFRSEPDLLSTLEKAGRRMSRDVADELAAMSDPATPPPPIPVDMLAYALNMALHSALTRAAWDSNFSLLDFVRTNVWLWLAVRASMSGRVDINSELAQYEDRIRRLVDTPAPVLGPPDE
jgi:DNA-binding transcriptional MerR regulator